MLTCIARSKQPNNDSLDQPNKFHPNAAPPNKQSVKTLTSQIKDMALKASGAYKQCSPTCATQPSPLRKNGSQNDSDSAASLDKFRWSYKRTGSSSSSSTAGRKELEARLKGISSGDVTPVSASASGRRAEPVVFVEESEPKEWVAQVEPGVLITFVSLPRGGNDLKRIRFSREIFNKYQAQRWWSENCEKVMELYNVQRLNRQAFPLPTPPRSEDESTHSRYNYDSCGVSSTPKLSSISGTKTEISSMDASMRTSTSRDADRSGELSISNASDILETEWIEQDEPGVYITIRALPDGRRELKRVRFSREKFGEVHARLWWEENRGRIHKQYLG